MCRLYQKSSEECIFLLCKETPYCYEEIEQYPLHVIIVAAISTNHLIGPFSFDSGVNHTARLNMLEMCFALQLREIDH
jgi:hypothetical protein